MIRLTNLCNPKSTQREIATYNADVTPGKSIRLWGCQPWGSKSAHVNLEAMDLPFGSRAQALREAALAGNDVAAVAALADLLEESGDPQADLCRRCYDAASELMRRPAAVAAGPLAAYVTEYRDFDLTFKVGDLAEHDSYNLTYTGRIKSITAKTVSIVDDCIDSRVRRLSLYQFAWRNWDFNAAKVAKDNADMMQTL